MSSPVSEHKQQEQMDMCAGISALQKKKKEKKKLDLRHRVIFR